VLCQAYWFFSAMGAFFNDPRYSLIEAAPRVARPSPAWPGLSNRLCSKESRVERVLVGRSRIWDGEHCLWPYQAKAPLTITVENGAVVRFKCAEKPDNLNQSPSPAASR
jgi:hypothetical protein